MLGYIMCLVDNNSKTVVSTFNVINRDYTGLFRAYGFYGGKLSKEQVINKLKNSTKFIEEVKEDSTLVILQVDICSCTNCFRSAEGVKIKGKYFCFNCITKGIRRLLFNRGVVKLYE